MAVNEPIWSIGEIVIGVEEPTWSYGESYFTGEPAAAPTSVIAHDILWSAGTPAIVMGSSYSPQPEWEAGTSYVAWELVEGVVFGQVEMAGVVIG